ncbi:hypothetical protein KIW84_072977 [Lathyrus oleraceus]|uniref:Uncharacterized protein n=1 Tax=Pisum sativum TaxID=3888 RepID=A0A9D4VME4_PEA|nr:hypothetical protein KIW84_072977 [Pisum sativum]
MGRVFFLDLEGRAYRCIFCQTPFALADHVLSRIIAHEKSEAYKEGKFVLERWRIVDDVEEELSLDANASSSESDENP